MQTDVRSGQPTESAIVLELLLALMGKEGETAPIHLDGGRSHGLKIDASTTARLTLPKNIPLSLEGICNGPGVKDNDWKDAVEIQAARMGSQVAFTVADFYTTLALAAASTQLSGSLPERMKRFTNLMSRDLERGLANVFDFLNAALEKQLSTIKATARVAALQLLVWSDEIDLTPCPELDALYKAALNDDMSVYNAKVWYDMMRESVVTAEAPEEAIRGASARLECVLQRMTQLLCE